MADVDLNAPLNQAAANKVALTNMFSNQRGESQDFLNRLTGIIGGQESSTMMSDRIGKELNLPTLRSNSNQLQNTLFNLPSTYSKAMTGYDVNANQLARVIGQKQSELAPAAALAEKNLQSAESNLTQRLGLAQRDQDRALIPYQYESEQLNSRLAREASGFSQAMQSELDAIIAKMNAGVQISEGEKNRANALAVAEQNFQNQMKMAQYNNSQPNYVQLNGGLYNTTSNSWSVRPPLSKFG